MEHSAVLAALPWLPIASLIFLVAMEVGARTGVAGAGRFVDGFRAAGAATKVAMLLMLFSAVVHVALVPSHLGGDPLRAWLFGILAAAMVGVSIWAFTLPHWRPAAVGVLAAAILAHLVFVALGQEQVEAVGSATRLIEVVALTLCVIRGRAISVWNFDGDEIGRRP
jgi:hypothetical protein